MAAVQAIRDAYGRLGFAADAAVILTDVQGIDSIDELVLLTDAEVGNLCKVARHPGGTVPNPNFDVNNPQAGVPVGGSSSRSAAAPVSKPAAAGPAAAPMAANTAAPTAASTAVTAAVPTTGS